MTYDEQPAPSGGDIWLLLAEPTLWPGWTGRPIDADSHEGTA